MRTGLMAQEIIPHFRVVSALVLTSHQWFLIHTVVAEPGDRAHKYQNPTLDTISRQLNPLANLSTYLLINHLKFILPSSPPTSSKWTFCYRLPHQRTVIARSVCRQATGSAF